MAQAKIKETNALSIKVGEADLYPSLRIDYSKTDNAFLTATQPTEASDVTVSPELIWVADRRLLSLEGKYEGEYNVSSEDALNYADHTFSFSTDAELTSRKRVEADIAVNFGHETLGQGLTRGFATKDDKAVETTDISAGAKYTFGAKDARGNVSAGLEIRNVGYNSRSDLTTNRGFSTFSPFAEFSLRIGGDTRLLTEIRFSSTNFEAANRDRIDFVWLTGLQFAATGKSGGAVRFGVLQSQYDNSVSDQTSFVFRASLFWEPATFSRFELQGNREIDNEGSSLVAADSIATIRDFVAVSWTHRWSSRFSHSASVIGDNRSGSCPELDLASVFGRIEFNLQVQRQLQVGFGASSTRDDLTDCPSDVELPDLDYEQARFGVHIRATL